MDRYAQAEKDREYSAESQTQTGTPTQESREWVWKEADVDIGLQAYRNMHRDLLYLQDTYSNGLPETQTDFDDWQQDRYAVKLKKNFQPPEKDDQVLHSTMDWEEAQAFLEAKAGDFE